jgi:hypothetical protein
MSEYQIRKKEYIRKWMRDNREHMKIIRKNWRQENKDEIIENQLQFRKKNPTYARDWNRRKKIEVIIHYGGDPPKCACCGETIFEFLTIDHINGGGLKHRQLIKRYNIYNWLVKNNFPEGYQVLCFNCNCGKEINKGICPHKR